MQGFRDVDRHIDQLQGSIAHQKAVAASLARNGYMGAAAEVLVLVGTLQARLETRLRHTASQKQLAGR